MRHPLVSIQILRALAAIAVAALHTRLEMHAAGYGAPPAWLGLGAAGVDVFFVISGFIITLSARPTFARPGAWRAFAARRIRRVVPLYWIATFLQCGLLLVLTAERHTKLDWHNIAASFLFVPYLTTDQHPNPIHAVGWTLNYEMFFYAVFALAIAAGRARALLLATPALALIVAAGAVWPGLPYALHVWASPIVLEFLAGVGLAVLYDRGVRMPAWGGWLLAGAGAIALSLQGGAEPGTAMRPLVWGVPALAIVAAAALAPQPSEKKPPVRLLAYLGAASYAIYLMHPFALIAFNRAAKLSPALRALPPDACWAGLFLAALASSLIAYELIERPISRALGRRRATLAPA